MEPSLTLDRFCDLATRFAVVPLAVAVLGDIHTPVSVFDQLVGTDEGFLLESVEGGERWGRWSFIGWDPAFTVSARNGITTCSDPGVDIPEGDPLEVLESLIGRYTVPPWDEIGVHVPRPPLHSGAVGYLSYDTVRYIETLPNRPPDDRGLPEMLWQFVGGLAAFDRLTNSITLIRNVFVGDDPEADYLEAVRHLDVAIERLTVSPSIAVGSVLEFDELPETTQTIERDVFMAVVDRAITEIRDGEVFQVVPSIRFAAEFNGDTLAVYRALRIVNPSPYMFLLQSGEVSIAGSSPELMSRVRDGVVYSRPIAGTRPRGATDEEDRSLEAELLADPKERAEHVMLIDLARNDLGKVSTFGSVVVDDLMVIERYSHVMHIVSGVSGELVDGIGLVDVLRATFPHGTVSGAPKVRAMELIDEFEPVARGPYAGAVGYLDFSGNMDTAIALRTCVMKGSTAWVQAGAGIVVDSDAAREYDECVNKARAVLAAIAASRELER
ncbi:Anthranilate synthase, aminase component [hydrothermal vent metagenome]|uniref:Anthranilate synthase component 1 n=1 Tax=hydrothermal vent metagenome TaxID=652676 RepID=A0A3B0S5Y1_9ZZZZ